MKELQIGKNDAGQRLDRFLSKAVPLLPPSLLQKYIRLKRVKVNGKGSKRDTRLCEGDLLQLYVNDEFFEKPNSENAFLTIAAPLLDVVYEDEHILLVNKRPGQVVHADESGSAKYADRPYQSIPLSKKRMESPLGKRLCPCPVQPHRPQHRRHGVSPPKAPKPCAYMNDKIRSREILKYYLCITLGRPTPAEGTLSGYLFKDESKKQVFVRRVPSPGRQNGHNPL